MHRLRKGSFPAPREVTMPFHDKWLEGTFRFVMEVSNLNELVLLPKKRSNFESMARLPA